MDDRAPAIGGTPEAAGGAMASPMRGRLFRKYLLLILSRDMASYNEFLNTQILDHPSVHSASSSFALRRVKYTTALPLQD